MENINTKNDWDWRIYCNNRKCDFRVELKLEKLKIFFDENLERKFLKQKRL